MLLIFSIFKPLLLKAAQVEVFIDRKKRDILEHDGIALLMFP